jgi:hypothetical protein
MGLLMSLANGAQALGGFVAPILVVWLGVEGALVAIGVTLPVVAALTWPGIRHVDRDSVVDTVRLARIRADPLFAPLSMAIVEQLADQLRPVTFAAGEWLMHEGDAGDRYYLLDAGRVTVSQQGRVIRECGPGESVGEIALLRDVPRTASVQAVTPVEALALARDDFLETVTGHPASRLAADAIVSERLAT